MNQSKDIDVVQTVHPMNPKTKNINVLQTVHPMNQIKKTLMPNRIQNYEYIFYFVPYTKMNLIELACVQLLMKFGELLKLLTKELTRLNKAKYPCLKVNFKILE